MGNWHHVHTPHFFVTVEGAKVYFCAGKDNDWHYKSKIQSLLYTQRQLHTFSRKSFSNKKVTPPKSLYRRLPSPALRPVCDLTSITKYWLFGNLEDVYGTDSLDKEIAVERPIFW